jgi:hypothetical protein
VVKVRIKSRLIPLAIALLLAILLFIGDKHISEAQSAKFYLTWTVDCAKGEAVKIIPKYDSAFDWKDSYSGVVERIVPLAFSYKASSGNVSKNCNGWISTRASKTVPMDKTHVSCYAVP